MGNFLIKEILVVEKCPKKEIQTVGIFLKKEIFWHFGHQNLSQKGNIAIKTHPKKEIFWHFWQSNLFLKRKFTSAYVINLHQRSRLYKESNVKPPHPRNLMVNPWLSPEGACHRFTVMFLTHPCWELSVMLCHPCKGFYINSNWPLVYSYVMGEQDDTYSQYKPLLDRTKDYNSDNQANCGILLSGTTPTPPPIPWTLPWSPAPPPIPRSPLWRPCSISPSDERGDTAVQNELPSPNDTLEFGVGGPIGEDRG